MMRRKLITLITTLCKSIIVLFILSCVFLYGCNKGNSHLEFCKTVDEVINKIENKKSEVAYENFLDITLKEPEIISDISEGLQPDTNYISENIIVKNISDYPIKISCKVYLPKEIINTIAYVPTTFEHGEVIELGPQKELDMAAAIIMKTIDAMTEEEKNIFDKYSRVVYIEVTINGKRSYLKKEI